MNNSDDIIEKKLGISPDYQYRALRSNNIIQSNWHQNKLDILNLILKKIQPKSMLDLGTGSGNTEFEFSRSVKTIVGVDYHKEALGFLKSQLSKRKIKNVNLIHSDIREVSNYSKYGKFDFILLMDVIEHIREKDAIKLLKQLQGLLNQDGYLCIITPNYNSTWLFIEKILDKFSSVPHLEDQQHLFFYNENNLKLILKKTNYLITDYRTFNLFFFLPILKSWASKIAQLEYSSKSPWGNLIVVLAQKS